MGPAEVSNCQEAWQHFWTYLDQECDQLTSAQLEVHLAECGPCRRALEFDRHTKVVVRRCWRSEPVSSDVITLLRQRLEQLLGESGGPAEA